MTETNEKEHRSDNITYTQAGVSCFVGQESGKLKVQFFVGSSVVKALPAYSWEPLALTLKDNDSDKNEDERNKRKSQRTNGTFAKPHKPTQNPSFAKEPFFANARPTQLSNIKTNIKWNFSINFSHINRSFNLTVIPWLFGGLLWL